MRWMFTGFFPVIFNAGALGRNGRLYNITFLRGAATFPFFDAPVINAVSSYSPHYLRQN